MSRETEYRSTVKSQHRQQPNTQHGRDRERLMETNIALSGLSQSQMAKYVAEYERR